MVGIRDGFNGLMFPEQYADGGLVSTAAATSCAASCHLGGTILGTHQPRQPDALPGAAARRHLRRGRPHRRARAAVPGRVGIDALITIGGDGSLTIGERLHDAGLRVIGVPKTIDNDLDKTHQTFGFDTAVGFATECIDRLFSTATSHGRVIVVEVMGRYAGWIALESGMASSAHAILIPEIPFDLEPVAATIAQREARGAKFSIVVVAEGAAPVGGERVGASATRSARPSSSAASAGRWPPSSRSSPARRRAPSCSATCCAAARRPPFDRLLGLRFGAAAVRGLRGGSATA